MNEESRGWSESTDSLRLRQVEEINRISGGAALWDLEWYLPVPEHTQLGAAREKTYVD